MFFNFPMAFAACQSANFILSDPFGTLLFNNLPLDVLLLVASYRYDECLSGLFPFNISSGFHLGYAHEKSIQSTIDGLENNTHELLMRLRM